MATAAIALGAASACGSDPAIIIEVRGRPALGDVAALEVTVANEGATQTELFDLDGHTLPATFSITVGGRTGMIDIFARGLDGEIEVGRGGTTVDAADRDGSMFLDPSDFVVNTEFAGDQAPNQDIETNGFQITAGGGVVTLGFGDDCPVSVCNQFGRRFGADGRPQTTALGAGINQFRWNQTDGQFAATLGVASQPDGSSIALWDTPSGVACRAMTADGQADAAEVLIAPDMGADVVSAAPFPDGSYGVVWVADDVSMIRVIRGMVVSGSCATRINPFTTAGSISFANRPTVAETPRATLVAWIENFTNARFRIGTSGGAFSPTGAGQTGAILISATAPNVVDFVRAASLGDGFAVAYHRSAPAFEDDAILLRRTDETGAQRGPDTLIATGVAYGAPAIVVRPTDGAMAIAWAQCDTAGDGAGCAVLVQVLRPTGLPVGLPVQVNTTTLGDQDRPSIAALDDGFVVGFADASMTDPDISAGAVRARFIYPPYDEARGVTGARCAVTAECDPGLVCGEDSTADRMCQPGCDPGGPCPGGGTCVTAGTESYCRF